MVFWIAILLLAAFSVLSYGLGKRRAVRGEAAGRGHSRPAHQAAWTALMAGAPAAFLLIAFVLFGGRVEQVLLSANPPAAVAQLPSEQAEVFWRDARVLGDGGKVETAYDGPLKTALDQKAQESARLGRIISISSLALAFVIALLGLALALPRLSPQFRARNQVEGWVKGVLIASSAVAVLTTVGIVASLAFEAFRFFGMVSPVAFLTGTEWSPQTTMNAAPGEGAFGAIPLFVGTFLIMLIAMAVAGPIGLFSAIYLSEYAKKGFRDLVKPLLEVLAGIPTVVFGFFALVTVGPLFRQAFNWLGSVLPAGPVAEYLMQVQNQMALTAGIVMGVMLTPFVSSLADDIINAVPQALRDGSYAMGATKSETIKKVVLPAAMPGVVGAMQLAVSRAIGETMIVTMAAGLQAKLTLNPLDTVTTITAQIVILLQGDQEFDSATTLSVFGLGLTLFFVTLILNLIALSIVRRYREQYD